MNILSGQSKTPILPLRDIVVFPHMVVPLFVGRDKSVRALEAVMKSDKQILLVTQKDAVNDDPTTEDLFTVGVLGHVLQLLKLPDGTVKVLVEGGRRVTVQDVTLKEGYFVATASDFEETDTSSQSLEGLTRAVIVQFEQYVKLNKKIPPEIMTSIGQLDDTSKIADTISSHLALSIEDKQALLEMPNIAERLERIFSYMENEIDVLEVEKRVRSRVKKQMEKTQREYYLNEQMKAIQKELNDGDEDSVDDIAELEANIKKTRFSKEARAKAESEFKKLKQMSPMSAESSVVRNYLDWLLAVPWKKRSKVKKDLILAKKVLDQDHYGLEKVKERILEYLAVQQRTDKVKGPILCLMGPPGVGKTSLGRSIAEATNRNYVRMSLGGVRDESEIRGHRRTYIGSMPGKIVQGMKKAKKSNPLFLLDEIDKLGNDYRGDPSSALLEVLDPEQNGTFQDHYLEVEYDLSDVMFICTSNSLDMPRPLLDRMEIIRLSGYTEDEKVQIAKRHLIKKQLEMNGLKPAEFSITDTALRDLIRYYTREAGVRNLEREISGLARKAIKEILMKKRKTLKITPKNLERFAGVKRYDFGLAHENDAVGVVTGLAWTETGGDLLSIESVMIPGKEKTAPTGNLKDVMKESVRVAETLIKSRAPALGVDPRIFEKKSLQVHVPAGAVPKDGPSAGIAMVTTMVSTLTGIPVCRDVAMTGEIRLSGRVLPIGGLKEKLLAAVRGGITKVLIPYDNAKDLVDIPENVKRGLDIIPVKAIEEVLEHALVRQPEPISDEILAEIDKIPPKTAENQAEDVIHH